MADDAKAATATALDDIDMAAFMQREALAELLAEVDRTRTELCFAAGAAGYSWARVIPPAVAKALDEVAACARRADCEAIVIMDSVRTAVAGHG